MVQGTNPLYFTEDEGSLPCSQQPAFGPHTESSESKSRLHR